MGFGEQLNLGKRSMMIMVTIKEVSRFHHVAERQVIGCGGRVYR